MQIAMLFARPGRARRISTGIVIAAMAAVVAAEAVHHDLGEIDAETTATAAVSAPAAVVAAPTAVAAARAAFDRPAGMLPGSDEPHAAPGD